MQIPVSKFFTMPVEVKAGSVVEWHWTLESGNINNIVRFKANGSEQEQEVYKGERITNHKGSFTVSEDGTISFFFDNSFSWLASKVVLGMIDIHSCVCAKQSNPTQPFFFLYMRNSPNSVSAISRLCTAARLSPSTRRVSLYGITPSSHSRAVLYKYRLSRSYFSRIGFLNASSSSALHVPPTPRPSPPFSPLRSIASRFTVLRTVAACIPPITEIRLFGYMYRKRGEKARPAIP